MAGQKDTSFRFHDARLPIPGTYNCVLIFERTEVYNIETNYLENIEVIFWGFAVQ